MDEEAILKMVNEAEEVESLDEVSIKRMILTLEKKMNENLFQRSKYGEDPEKFLESEMELDEELKKMQILSTAPEFYPLLAKLGAVSSLVSLFTHENVDIVVDLISLLFELTDPDTLTETKQTIFFVDALLEGDFLEYLVENIKRMNEKDEEESKAVHNALGIIENLIEVRPDLSELVTTKTKLLKYLLEKIQQNEFDDNKLYCGEILSILVQNSTLNQQLVGKENGIDFLLMAISKYRKKEPENANDEEVVENLFDTLCFCLQEPENRNLFRKLDGFRLMLILIKGKGYCRKSALKALDAALADNESNCFHFVEVLGLKTLFASFMKKSEKKAKKGFDEAKDEEHIASCIVSLLNQLKGESLDRLLSKFSENNGEKIDRLVELHEKYTVKLARAEKEFAAEEEEEEESELYLKKLDAGLFTLELVDQIIDRVHSINKEQVEEKMKKRGQSMESVKKILLNEERNNNNNQ
eukprot:TRINITY_DN5780_c0_g1_i1.p1 TRINITY_DN5780_c0_g1~~TRINITY_DN5780_c0_g1_i1.p1  ORF type:complete len:530 (+),score=240.99 TRINITY_DN5780_c0_g1_i1:181-1590(+)